MCKLDKVINFVYIFKMLKCIELDERLKAMDQEITVNPQFVQKVMIYCLVRVCTGFSAVRMLGAECQYLQCKLHVINNNTI